MLVNSLPSVSRHTQSANLRYAIGMTKLPIALLIIVSIAVGVFAPYQVDFRAFYQAGHDVLSGVNPYASTGFYNPIHVAVAFAPIALIQFDVAWHLWAGLSFAIYVIALSRLMKQRVLWLALLAPFGLLIAWYGNLDALVLLGVTLPTPIGVWLLFAKPQIGLFAAALMLWQYRSWRLALAVGAVLVASLALGMIHGGLATNVSISPWPWGLLIGVPLLIAAWRKHSAVIALGAAVFVSPYITALNAAAALPLFRANRRVMALGVVLSWIVFVVWRSRL